MMKDQIKTIFSDSKKRVKLIAFMGFAAIILILISELIPKNTKGSTDSETPKTDSVSLVKDNTEKTEKRLAELLSDIKGVGKTELILSVEGSEEYIYAEETETSADKNDSETSEKYKNKLFVTERSGSKEALVKKIINPRFNGALVICDGGGDPLVRERVIKAVSAALDLPTSKICVECRKI